MNGTRKCQSTKFQCNKIWGIWSCRCVWGRNDHSESFIDSPFCFIVSSGSHYDEVKCILLLILSAICYLAWNLRIRCIILWIHVNWYLEQLVKYFWIVVSEAFTVWIWHWIYLGLYRNPFCQPTLYENATKMLQIEAETLAILIKRSVIIKQDSGKTLGKSRNHSQSFPIQMPFLAGANVKVNDAKMTRLLFSANNNSRKQKNNRKKDIPRG